MGGGHKFMRRVGGSRIIEWVVERLRPQVSLLITSTGAIAVPLEGGMIGVPDVVPDGGPLAGIHAALTWAAVVLGPETRIVTVPADTPFIPPDLVRRFQGVADDPSSIVVAESASGPYYAVGSWPVGIAGDLGQWLGTSGSRSIRAFLAAHNSSIARFDGDPDPFFNINTPADLAAAEVIALGIRA